MNVIKVGIADLNIALFPDHIRTSGLGSCVGVAVYDRTQRIAGLAHVMLPSSSLGRGEDINIAKYADTAIPHLIDLMVRKGCNKRNLIAKIAGGAQMFNFSGTNTMMRIGERNTESCKEILSKLDIPILGEDTGGNVGRTIEMSSESGILSVRTLNKGTIDI